MRIFDPKDQFGNAILSSADTQKSSVKLEKQMAVGGAITLTSTDISDIENWELSSATVTLTNESKASFLPDTVRNSDGSLTINFGGDDLTGATLVMKRSAFDGMKPITIEIKIKRLMAKTMTAATAATPRTTEEVNASVAEWKALGEEAVEEEPENYPYAACSTPEQLTTAEFDLGATTIGNDVCLISFDSLNTSMSGSRTFPNVQEFGADLPSLKVGTRMFHFQKSLKSFTGKIPNLTNANSMFYGCTGLTSWTVALPNSLTTASNMFQDCTSLTSWTVALPNIVRTVDAMFSGCKGLTSWTVALPNSITTASYMFQDCSGLNEWTVALPNNLTSASYMFSGCTGLTSWTVALPDSIIGAQCMFSGCKGLTSWNVALPNSITNAQGMFSGCTGLTSWNVALPDTITQAGGIIERYGMFSGCSKLESFTVPMPTGLKKNARYMFRGCKLNLASVKKISETIQTCTGTSADDKTFTLGIAKSLEEDAEVQGYLKDIRDKDWTVEVSYNA